MNTRAIPYCIAALLPASCFILAMAAATPLPEKAISAKKNDYIGSSDCRECHEVFYQKWSTSHHGKAMQPFTAELARDYLSPQTNDILVGETRFRAEFDATGGWMTGTEPDGTTKRYPIEHALGGKNVYFFLTELDRGHLQVMPVSYNVRTKQWYNTTESMVRHFDDAAPDEALDWTDRMLTFNTACFDCHVSQLQKNYNEADDSYQTTWKEPGINCETCHGPAEEHVRVCREAAARGEEPKEMKLIRFHDDLNKEQRDATCFPCHAKMSPVTDSFTPGEAFFDHYDLTAFEDSDFYPDGRHLGENYTITHWLSNPCLEGSKMECITCHTSSGRFRFKENPNQACLPCHQSRVDNVEKHSHHPKDSKGSQCISCHMPARLFGNMMQSDHSHFPPTPATTLEFGTPNACNICHTEKDAEWAHKKVIKWHGNKAQEVALKRGRMIQAARNAEWEKLPDILAYLEDPDCHQVAATSLLRLLQNCPDNSMWPAIRRKLDDPSPLVRSAAASTMQYDTDPVATELLLKAAQDKMRLVRIRAASSLMSHPVQNLNEEQTEIYEAARQEYWESLIIWPDRWSTHYNQGIYKDRLGDQSGALKSYEKALSIRDDMVAPMVNASMAYARQGNSTKAYEMLKKAIDAEPENAMVNFNMALMEGEFRNMEKAEKHLRVALKSDPRMAQAAFNLGVILCQQKKTEGLKWSRKAADLVPQNPQYLYTYAFFNMQFGDLQKAESILKKAIANGPAYAENYFLLAKIYQQKNQLDAAAKIYKDAGFNKQLPEEVRRRALYMEEQLRSK